MAGKRRCGSPRRARSSRIRPRPNSSGQGLRDSSQAMSAFERIELAPVPLELLPLSGDHVWWRVREEALDREHALRACDLFAQALDLTFAAAVHRQLLPAHDRVEDAALVVGERDEHAAPARDAGRVLDTLERGRVRGEALVRLGPGRDDETRLPRRELRPDL